MRQSSITDIISPIMTGPSSSHTAGAVRLGLLARNIYNAQPKKVTFRLYNSYSFTGKGHGTDKGLMAGVLGLTPDDRRIKKVFDLDLAKEIEYEFEFSEDFNRHPNAVDIIFEGDLNMSLEGDSVGAGKVVIRKIDGFKVKVTGNFNTLLIIHKDVPGVISRVTKLIQDNNVNVAYMHCDRKSKGGEASIEICFDEELDPCVVRQIEDGGNCYLVRYVRKLA